MWDDSHALRRLTNALFGASLLLLLAGALGYVLRLPAFALRAVQLDTAPQRVDKGQLEAAVRDSLHGNFFTVNLDQARHVFEKLPWVRRVGVRRHFPWQLDVELEEHVALARWNGTALVNTEGEVFTAKDDEALPEFNGPEGAAEEMARHYARFSEMLAPLGQGITQVTLSSRYAWQLRLKDGLVVELGREQMEERLARFAAAYPQYVAAMRLPAKYVDLRYRNGFAARMTAG
jgi:cell division protein FtsQ